MTAVQCYTKVVPFTRLRKRLFLLVELRHLSGNHHSLKAYNIINWQNFWGGFKKMVPHFSHATQ